MSLSNKIILLTGGTGSFGKKFTEIALKEFKVKTIRIFSRGELKQQQMKQTFKNNERLRFLIGDVRDRNRLYRAMTRVDLVVHAAALKQVPTCEYNPIEAIRTNIDGAVNVIDAAIDAKVKKVIALSTDKAVHPINLYGATKLVAEKLFIQANSYTSGKPKISCVRYGNVIGSSGSVIPLFKKQKRNGVITITDERMTRFWITLEQAVKFVINCIGKMKGGEVFVPKIPSMKVIDLVDVIAPNVKRKVIGIRPGEKINETLLVEEEARYSKEWSNYFVIEPRYSFCDRTRLKEGKLLTEGFTYTSENNNWWLTKNDIKKMLAEGS